MARATKAYTEALAARVADATGLPIMAGQLAGLAYSAAVREPSHGGLLRHEVAGSKRADLDTFLEGAVWAIRLINDPPELSK